MYGKFIKGEYVLELLQVTKQNMILILIEINRLLIIVYWLSIINDCKRICINIIDRNYHESITLPDLISSDFIPTKFILSE